MSIDSSSVAGGGGGATVSPMGLKSMQNSTFLVLFGRFLLQKWKQPPNGIGEQKFVKDLLLFGSEKWSFLDWLNFGEDLFFVFRDHLISAGKTVSEEGEELFFLEII